MAAESVKVAVVTGSNKGIGLAIVRALCRQFKGDVYVTSRDAQRGNEAVEKLKSEGLNPLYHQLDITSTESIECLKKFIVDKYGGIDVLVNNAGMAYKGSSTAPAIEQATVTVETNFTGTLNMMRAFVPIVKPRGRVVNVSSMVSHLARLSSQSLRDQFSSPALTETELVALMESYITDVKEGKKAEKGWANTHYSVSKIGMTALTKIYAREMAASGAEDVLINCCCPGWVKTDMAGDKAPLTPDQGAETPVLLALLPPGAKPNGEFWREKAATVW